MKSITKDIRGVSPVIGTLLMIAITVSLSGTVYIMTSQYTDMAQGGPEIVNIKVSLYAKGIKETDPDGTPNDHTYSGLKIEIISNSMLWSKYKVLLDAEKVFTIPFKYIAEGTIPDANDDPEPENYGRTFAGEEQWFSEEGYRNDFLPLTAGKYYVNPLISPQWAQTSPALRTASGTMVECMTIVLYFVMGLKRAT